MFLLAGHERDSDRPRYGKAEQHSNKARYFVSNDGIDD